MMQGSSLITNENMGSEPGYQATPESPSRDLGPEQQDIVESRLRLLLELNGKELRSPLRESLKQGDTRLPVGTLIHGTQLDWALDKIGDIAKHGVVSGELFGIP